MFTVEEIWEEQERQYNQLMEEDDQYCHPESFRWGFEHGVEYALTKLGWHPANKPPKEKDVEVVMLVDVSSPQFTGAPLIRVPMFCRYINGWPEDVNVKWWCYLPEKEE